jgi:hypothetical protein
MREFCTSGSAGGPGGVIPWGYPTYISMEQAPRVEEQFLYRPSACEPCQKRTCGMPVELSGQSGWRGLVYALQYQPRFSENWL